MVIRGDIDIRNDRHGNPLRHARQQRLPMDFIDIFHQGITIFILVLVHIAFRLQIQGNLYKTFRPFKNFIIYETSHAEGSYLFPLFDHLYRSLLPNTSMGLWLRMIYIAGPFHLGPHTSGPPSIYTAAKHFFFFDRVVSQATPAVHFRNTIQTFQLNFQYRVHQAISNVSNSLSGRFVQPRLIDQRQ